MSPLPSGIEQPFNSSLLGVKRQSKIQPTSAAQLITLVSDDCMIPQILFASGAGVGTEGAYQQLIASTTVTGRWISLTFRNGQATVSAFGEFDIATGAAASEVDFLTDIPCQYQGPVAGGGTSCIIYCSPIIEIASGTRISVRVKDNDASARDWYCGCQIWG